MLPIIEFDGLTVSLGGREILHGLSGALNGKAIGLLGPNGAGKSTFINTLLGFHKPSKGTVRVHGPGSQPASSGEPHQRLRPASASAHAAAYSRDSRYAGNEPRSLFAPAARRGRVL